MSTTQYLIQANLELLAQAKRALTAISEEHYCAPELRVCSGGLGAQLRHCLDFYQCFLRDVESARIDFDDRARDTQLECQPAVALQRLGELSERLTELDSSKLPEMIQVRSDTGAQWVSSTLDRELLSLVSHTVHHFAMMAAIMRLHGLQPEEGFGVAPSTLEYWQASAPPCAQ